MGAWNENILARVLNVVAEHHPDGASVDAARAGYEGPALEVAEAVGNSAAASGVWLPFNDAHMLAALQRDARPAPAGVRGAVVALKDGRLGFTAGGGRVIESLADDMVLVLQPEPGRYVSAWLLPGVDYLGVT